jgi:hypothetical protein
MQIPMQINSEHADLSQAARAAIEHEVGRLEKCEHHITGCRVAVVAPSTKHRHGSVYRINIWVTIPPHENIVVSHQLPMIGATMTCWARSRTHSPRRDAKSTLLQNIRAAVRSTSMSVACDPDVV